MAKYPPRGDDEQHSGKASAKVHVAKHPQRGGHHAYGGARSDIGGKASVRAAMTAKHPLEQRDNKTTAIGQTLATMSMKHIQAQHRKEQHR